jgi:pantothenate kinase type III
MILAIDIGNTTTTVGVFERSRLRASFAMATQPGRTPDEVTLQLKALASTRRLPLATARQIILCSVVPRMSAVLMSSLRSLADAPRNRGAISGTQSRQCFALHGARAATAGGPAEAVGSGAADARGAGQRRASRRPSGSGRSARSRPVPIRVVGQDVQVPLVNRYTYPEQVGQDRLVGAYAAWRAFRTDCLVADFGTAITIDLVTKAGEYLGGVIAPGLDLSLEALAAKTALLPKVELGEPPELLGRDTANSIRSGILYGCAALCDGLVSQLKRRYAPAATVVATGGSSPLMARHMRSIDHLKPNLVLEGLFQLSLLPG